MKKNIISFDLSLSCTGFCVFNNDATIIEIGSIETNKDDITPVRLQNIFKKMKSLKRKYNPSKILIERGFYRFAGSTEQIFRVHGICNVIFYDIEQIEVHATSVRKNVMGKGNAKKEELRDFILNKYSKIKFMNSDEIDAFALGLFYFNKIGVI